MAVRDEPAVEAKAAKLKGFDDFAVRLGDTMRGERATLGKSLLDVQRDLKIKAAYIAAIENSDPSAFETQGFVAGYVRSYARYLGMDPEDAYDTFCRESGFRTSHGMSSGASDKTKKKSKRSPRRGLDPLIASRTPYLPAAASRFAEFDARAAVSLSVLLVLIGGLGWGSWSVLQEIQRVDIAPVAQTPGVVSTVEPIAGFHIGSDSPSVDLVNAETTAAALDRLYQPRALELPVMVARDGPIGAVDPRTVGALAEFAAPLLADTAPPTRVDAIEIALAQAIEEAPIQVLEKGPAEVFLFAVRPAWVRVQSAEGTVLFEKILYAGERYLVPEADAAPKLRAGNSGSVYIEVDGETYGPVGSGTTVAKNVSLGADDLLETYQTADIDADPALKKIVAVAQVERAAATD